MCDGLQHAKHVKCGKVRIGGEDLKYPPRTLPIARARLEQCTIRAHNKRHRDTVAKKMKEREKEGHTDKPMAIWWSTHGQNRRLPHHESYGQNRRQLKHQRPGTEP